LILKVLHKAMNGATEMPNLNRRAVAAGLLLAPVAGLPALPAIAAPSNADPVLDALADLHALRRRIQSGDAFEKFEAAAEMRVFAAEPVTVPGAIALLGFLADYSDSNGYYEATASVIDSALWVIKTKGAA
jgi:hypothetical protein